MSTSVLRLPGMRALVGASFCGFAGYAALLSVAPLWAARGGAGEAGAGLVTFVLLAATVATQFSVPALLARFGYGGVVAVGLLLMGLPSPALLLSDALAPVLALSAVRGVGFGILTVTGTSVVARLVPVRRRGEAVGLYGLAATLPLVFLLPATVAVAQSWGFAWVFAVGLLPVLGVPAALRLGRVLAQAGPDPSAPAPGVPVAAGATRVALRAIAPATAVLFAITLGGGALMTFVPQILSSPALSAIALLVLGIGSGLCRWFAGRLSDRYGAQRFVIPLLGLSVLGLALFALAAHRDGEPWLVLLAVTLLGVPYGALQNLTLVLAFQRVAPAQIPVASAGWNIGYDAGTACGALLVGAVAAATSFALAFSLLAGICLLAMAASRVPARPGG